MLYFDSELFKIRLLGLGQNKVYFGKKLKNAFSLHKIPMFFFLRGGGEWGGEDSQRKDLAISAQSCSGDRCCLFSGWDLSLS